MLLGEIKIKLIIIINIIMCMVESVILPETQTLTASVSRETDSFTSWK